MWVKCLKFYLILTSEYGDDIDDIDDIECDNQVDLEDKRRVSIAKGEEVIIKRDFS